MTDLSKVLWAKKDSSEGKAEWLSLRQHLEDTSRICGFLWDHWLCDGQRELISACNDPDSGRNLMVFLGAIHDLGKATPAFQVKNSEFKRSELDIELLERLERSGAKGISELNLASGKASPHNVAGEVLLRRFAERFHSPDDISSIVGGHHGRPSSWHEIDLHLLCFKV